METKEKQIKEMSSKERENYIKFVIKKYVEELLYTNAFVVRYNKGDYDIKELRKELKTWLSIYRNILIMKGNENIIWELYKVQRE